MSSPPDRSARSSRCLVEDPQGIQDTSTIALAALALGVDSNAQPIRGERVSIPLSRRIFGGALLAGTGALAVQRMRTAGLVPDRRRAHSRVAILHETSYAGSLERELIEGLRLFDLNLRGKTVLLKPNLVESIPGAEVNTRSEAGGCG